MNESQQVKRNGYVVTFDRRVIVGRGAIAGLRVMPLADARWLVSVAAEIPKYGRIVNARTLQVVTAGHDCGEPGSPVDVAQCGDCWDYMDERHAMSRTF